MSNKINVNPTNSKVINERLFITGLKLNRLSEALKVFVIKGNTVVHPTLGTLYEYNGPYSRT